jgi:hypothetical protein
MQDTISLMAYLKLDVLTKNVASGTSSKFMSMAALDDKGLGGECTHKILAGNVPIILAGNMPSNLAGNMPTNLAGNVPPNSAGNMPANLAGESALLKMPALSKF